MGTCTAGRAPAPPLVSGTSEPLRRVVRAFATARGLRVLRAGAGALASPHRS